MKILGVSHIAVYGREMDFMKVLFSQVLGLEVSSEQTIDGDAKLAFLPVGDTEVELVAPLEAGNSFDKELDTLGLGVNHIAFEVDDIEAAIIELKDRALVAMDACSRPGAKGSKIIFLDQDKTGGVSIELVQSFRAIKN